METYPVKKFNYSRSKIGTVNIFDHTVSTFIYSTETLIIMSSSGRPNPFYSQESGIVVKSRFRFSRRIAIALLIVSVIAVGTVGAISFQTVSNSTSFGFTYGCAAGFGNKVCLQTSSITTNNSTSLFFTLKYLSPAFTYGNYFNTSVINVPPGMNMTLTPESSTITSVRNANGWSWLSGPFTTTPNIVGGYSFSLTIIPIISLFGMVGNYTVYNTVVEQI